MQIKQRKGDVTLTNYTTGADALSALNTDTSAGGDKNDFTPFKSGSSYKVKVLGTADLFGFFNYGIFGGVVNSFVAVNPSKKTAKGYPVENLTPWDKAWKYHKDLSKEFNDKHGQEASKYRCKHRFGLGFYDLTSGELIVIDLSKNQAQAVMGVINEYEDDLNTLAFTLKKTGSSTSTTVSLTPIINLTKGLTDEERANFENAPESFDTARFDGVNYEADEAEQVKLLTQAGFDVSLIGYSATTTTEAPATESSEGDSDPLPF